MKDKSKLIVHLIIVLLTFSLGLYGLFAEEGVMCKDGMDKLCIMKIEFKSGIMGWSISIILLSLISIIMIIWLLEKNSRRIKNNE